jgi:hypothetical protein
LPTERLPVFDPVRVETLIESSEGPSDVSAIRDEVRPWAEAGQPSGLGELSLEQAFNNDIFGTVLGYRLARPGREEFQFLPKQQATGGSGFPDFIIGNFTQNEDGELERDDRVAVGELKGPGTALDAGGSDEDGIDSPVEQAFNYSYTNGLGLRWVIVSNMEQIRLYHHGSINHYEEWTTEDFIEDDELTDTFWRFYYLMRRETLLGSPGEESPLESLFERDLSERLELTEDFYEFYREAVEDVYNELATEFSDRTDEIRVESN